MELTEEQKQALAVCLNPPGSVISVSGPAGSGKSKLLSEVARQDYNSVVLTPTNKAAIVLRAKGVLRATTIHAALYSPVESNKLKQNAAGETVFQKDADGKVLLDIYNQPIPEITGTDLSFALREDNLADLPPKAYVDESSMLQEHVLADLKAVFRHVVLFGDSFQLPPVKSKDVFKLHPPTAELKEVHRQALKSPILRYANELRTKLQLVEPELDGHHLNACSFNNKKLFQSIVDNSVQSICFTNKLRHILNDKIRAAKDLPPNTLKKGETVVSLDNVRVTLPGEDRAHLKFYNGEILTLAEDAPDAADFYAPVLLKFTDGRQHRSWPFWLPGFWEERESTRWNNKLLMLKGTGKLWGSIAGFDFSSVLTANKAQGSEYPNVAVFDQRSLLLHQLGSIMTLRWLYTALTRAQDRCLLVRC